MSEQGQENATGEQVEQPKYVAVQPFRERDLESLGAVKPYRQALPWVWSDNPEDSMYFWWFQYLKRNQIYMHMCEKGPNEEHQEFFRDWGDIRTLNDENSIRSWFEDRVDLFIEPGVSILEDHAQLDSVDLSRNLVLICPSVIDGVPLSPLAIRQQIEEYLDANYPSAKGSPHWSAAKYRVVGKKLDPREMKERLIIYDRCISLDNGTDFADIGEQLISEQLIPANGYYSGDGKKYLHISDRNSDRREMRKLIKRKFELATLLVKRALGKEFPGPLSGDEE